MGTRIITGPSHRTLNIRVHRLEKIYPGCNVAPADYSEHLKEYFTTVTWPDNNKKGEGKGFEIDEETRNNVVFLHDRGDSYKDIEKATGLGLEELKNIVNEYEKDKK